MYSLDCEFDITLDMKYVFERHIAAELNMWFVFLEYLSSVWVCNI